MEDGEEVRDGIGSHEDGGGGGSTSSGTDWEGGDNPTSGDDRAGGEEMDDASGDSDDVWDVAPSAENGDAPSIEQSHPGRLQLFRHCECCEFFL